MCMWTCMFCVCLDVESMYLGMYGVCVCVCLLVGVWVWCVCRCVFGDMCLCVGIWGCVGCMCRFQGGRGVVFVYVCLQVCVHMCVPGCVYVCLGVVWGVYVCTAVGSLTIRHIPGTVLSLRAPYGQQRDPRILRF